MPRVLRHATPTPTPRSSPCTPSTLSFLSRFRDVVPVVLRVVIGIIMATHGWQKLTAMVPANFGGGMLDPLGVPAPLAVAWLVTWIELAGGILLIVGA